MKVKELYTLQDLAHITHGKLFTQKPEQEIQHILTDSRASVPNDALFIALKGERFDGHHFIEDLLQKQSLAFLVEEERYIKDGHSFLLVDDTLLALQTIAKHHRQQFHSPVIGITGSFGKTIVKEWLFQLLSPDFYVVKSPKSYNSQVGVPLSVLQMNQKHELGIFEAGISQKNQMESLANIIQPTIGILTNIGGAHDAGFANHQEKIQEKRKLFSSCEVLILEDQNELISGITTETEQQPNFLLWSIQNGLFTLKDPSQTLGQQREPVRIPVNPSSNPYFAKNIGHCMTAMLYLGISPKEIELRIQQLETLPMRLELINGKWSSVILNDSYSNDLSGLQIALDYATRTVPQKGLVLCLGEFQESGLTEEELRTRIKSSISAQKIDFLLLFGPFYQKNASFFEKIVKNVQIFDSVETALPKMDSSMFRDQLIVCKGSRNTRLEQLVYFLAEHNHETVWEVNLSHLIANLNVFKSKLKDEVKLLVMVKATAYGTEANKLAQVLQNQRVDYLGVAYPEEGVSLRKEGIHLPILVMNTAPSQFQNAVNHQLEIQIYSLDHLQQFIHFVQHQKISKYPIHIKLETGMNRLGFEKEDLPKLKELLSENAEFIQIKGILSHLAVADQLEEREYTLAQLAIFDSLVKELMPLCDSAPILHVLNTAGILDASLPQYDMVRLGVGLHGISSNLEVQQEIHQVGRLIATISQLKTLEPGETVGYGRRFVADKAVTIATISIGYADGYDRRLGNGIGEVLLHGKRAKTVGSICMDMSMIDVSHIPEAKVGDEVILTSNELPITELAAKMNTIPYELLTSISTRVQRRFVYE